MRVLLGVSGSIAAYKAAVIARLLLTRNCSVQTVFTPSAQQFIAPLTFSALTGNAVRSDAFDEEAELSMGHIELARWADYLLIAPASANTIARIAAGMADDLLTTTCLATNAPIFVAPAMNTHMWSNATTQRNIARLEADGIKVLGPGSGTQACGDDGPGRMLEPDVIVDTLLAHKTACARSRGHQSTGDRGSDAGIHRSGADDHQPQLWKDGVCLRQCPRRARCGCAFGVGTSEFADTSRGQTHSMSSAAATC